VNCSLQTTMLEFRSRMVQVYPNLSRGWDLSPWADVELVVHVSSYNLVLSVSIIISYVFAMGFVTELLFSTQERVPTQNWGHMKFSTSWFLYNLLSHIYFYIFTPILSAEYCLLAEKSVFFFLCTCTILILCRLWLSATPWAIWKQ
jgi:hypothetical protein